MNQVLRKTDQQILLIGFDVSKAGLWDSTHKDTGTVHHNYQWNQEQWRAIERAAFRMLVDQMNGSTEWSMWEDAIPPEAMDYLDDVREGMFTEDELLNAAATAIGVVDAILAQFEEEAAKRDS